jgi:hypothetical protein
MGGEELPGNNNGYPLQGRTRDEGRGNLDWETLQRERRLNSHSRRWQSRREGDMQDWQWSISKTASSISLIIPAEIFRVIKGIKRVNRKENDGSKGN